MSATNNHPMRYPLKSQSKFPVINNTGCKIKICFCLIKDDNFTVFSENVTLEEYNWLVDFSFYIQVLAKITGQFSAHNTCIVMLAQFGRGNKSIYY